METNNIEKIIRIQRAFCDSYADLGGSKKVMLQELAWAVYQHKSLRKKHTVRAMRIWATAFLKRQGVA